MNTWILALKEWNQKKGGAWCVPRKGSEEHRQVMKLMGGTPKKAPVKKAPKQNIKFKVAPKKAPAKKAPAPKRDITNDIINEWGESTLPIILYQNDPTTYNNIEKMIQNKLKTKNHYS